MIAHPTNYNLRIVHVALMLALMPATFRAQEPSEPTPPRRIAIPAKDTSTFLIFKDVTAGPYFTAGPSRQNENLPLASSTSSTNPPWHSAAKFAFMFGGTIDFAVNWWLGLDFTALYDSRDAYVADKSESDNIDVNIGYLSFQPALRIFWLLVGVAFDLPMSGSATENIGQYYHPFQPFPQSYSENLNIPTSDLMTITEARATISIPVIEGDKAMLHLVISGSYPLSKFLRSATPSFDTTGGHFSGALAPGQGPLPTVQAGLSYQFDLLH